MVRLSLDTTVDHTAARPVVIGYVGTSARSLLFTATSDGTAIDLTSYTVTLSAQYKGDDMITAETMTLDDAAAGEISYALKPTDVAEAGDYDAQIRLVDGSTDIDYLEPFILRIEPVVHLT